MAYSILQQLRREGSLVLYHDYRQGTFKDLSGSANHGTPSTGCVWGGGGLTFPAATDEVTVADAASLQLTAGSVVVAGEFSPQSGNAIFVSKRAGAALNYHLYVSGGTFTMYDGASFRTLALNLSGAKSIGISFTDGGTPVGYHNGLVVGAFSGTVNVTPSNPVVQIGNYNNTSNFKSPFHAIIIANRILTETEMAAVHAELARL